jgi:hypothetical protein
VQYTVRQMHEIVGLSKETYRHWKRVLPPLGQVGGRAGCFTVGDLVAASILHRMTEVAGVRVGHLGDLAVAVFNLCNTTPWAALEGSALTIDLDLRQCQIESNLTPSSLSDFVLVCRLDPVLEELRRALLRTQGDSPQSELRFPPTALSASPDKRRREA